MVISRLFELNINRIIMKWRTFLLLFGFFAGCFGNFNEDTIDVNISINGTDANVELQGDMSQVVSAFFSAEFSNECGTGYIFGFSQKSGRLMLKEKPKPNDVLRIFGVFQTNSTIHSKSYQFIVNEDGENVKPLKNEISAVQNPCAKDQFAISAGYKGKLLLEENFANLEKWNSSNFSGMRTPNLEQTVYLKNATSIKNNTLHINASIRSERQYLNLSDCTVTKRKMHCTPLSYRPPNLGAPVNAGIIFRQDIKFKYGHFEVRAKFAKGDFLKSYILLREYSKDVNGESALQIHIAYLNGNENLFDNADNEIGGRTLHAGVIAPWHENMIDMQETKRFKQSNKHFGDEFHNYTMIWNEDSIIYKVDGEFYGAIRNRHVLDQLNTKKFYLVIGLTAGGKYNFPDLNLKLNSSIAFSTLSNTFGEWILKNHQQQWPRPNLEVDSIRVHEFKKY